MTIQTPRHLQRLGLSHEGHLIDMAMASDAADSLVDVNAVVEIDELGQVVNPVPFDRFAGAVTVADRSEHRAANPHLRVAIHAGFCRRDTRERRVLNVRVAIAAIDPQPANMVLVAERNRLQESGIGGTDVGAVDNHAIHPRHPESTASQEYSTFEIELKLRWKICGMSEPVFVEHPALVDPLYRIDCSIRATLLLRHQGAHHGNYSMPACQGGATHIGDREARTRPLEGTNFGMREDCTWCQNACSRRSSS